MTFTYKTRGDKDYLIRREWGFPGMKDAGQAKLALGKDLLAIIAKDGGVEDIYLGGDEGAHLNSKSSRFFGHNVHSIYARLGRLCAGSLDDLPLQYQISFDIEIGAKHRNKPMKEGRTFSEMYLSLTPADKHSKPVMESSLVKKIVEYLDNYQF